MSNPPKLKRKLEVKQYHGYEIKDEFSWIHQKNIATHLSPKAHDKCKNPVSFPR